MEGNYYVDSYNGAKVAKLENGQWVETTLEERYGHLAPINPDDPYIDPSPNYSTKSYGDDFHVKDRNYKVQFLYPIWTGDLTTRQVTDQDKQITEVDGIFVMRDTKGELVQLTIRLHSPDVQGDFSLTVKKMIDSTQSQSFPATGDPTNLLPLGKQVWLVVYYQTPKSAIVPSTCSSFNGYCSDEYNAGMRQFWAQETATQEFIKALNIGEKVPENSGLVLIPSHIQIKE